jgi:hypothetical protein
MGLPLAGALAGVLMTALAVPKTKRCGVPVGMGLGGLYSLLVMGRFFAQLATAQALLLFFAPALCIVLELPLLRRLGPKLRAGICLLLVGCLVAVVDASALTKFLDECRAASHHD